MHNLGIVLAGCEYFKENMEKGVRNDKQGLEEFYSRIVAWQTLGSPSKKEVEAIYKANDVDLESVSGKKYGNFRDVYNIVSEYQIELDITIKNLLEGN
jgi:hypothetical protein